MRRSPDINIDRDHMIDPDDQIYEGIARVEPAGGHPVTPDGRYFVVRGRLWRMSDPRLSTAERERLVAMLMDARRAVGRAKREGDENAERAARQAVDQAKQALGERGPIWWNDNGPDLNRHMARTTIYTEWFARLD
jgi:hypothetical protein